MRPFVGGCKKFPGFIQKPLGLRRARNFDFPFGFLRMVLNLQVVKMTKKRKSAAGRPAAVRPRPVGGKLVCPEGLSDDARAAFAQLAAWLEQEGLATPSHTELVALAARRKAEVEMHDRAVQADGVTYETMSAQGGRMIRANPAVAMLAEASRHLHAILVELGLSPMSVAKAAKPKQPQEANPFAALAAKRGAAKKGE